MKKVWVNGCFDVLHHAHFKLLEHAASFGELLIVGIDSDKRVKELKGDDRPFHTQEERKYNLERVKGVKRVVIFDSPEMLEELIKTFEPDVFVIGSDYKDKAVIGSEYAGELIFFERIGDYSTTSILEKK